MILGLRLWIATPLKRLAMTQNADSRSCGGALCDSKNLGVGVTLSGNDCPQFFRNARMLTQDRIYEGVLK